MTSDGTRVDWTGRTLRLEIGGPAHGGEFVARHEGRVVFCRGVVTGDVAEVEIVDDPGRGFCRGVVRTVLVPSSDRVDPCCPAAAAGAGCCDWSHVDPSASARLKGVVVAEQLSRLGGVPTADVPVHRPGDPAVTGWRTVARWVTDPGGVPGFRAARSATVVTEPCAQPVPELTGAILDRGWEPGTEVLGVIDDDGRVHLATRPVIPSRPTGGRRASSSRRARVARAAPWTVTDPGPVVRSVGAVRWELPVDAFWQAHRSAATHYSSLVASAVAGLDPAHVWDLYGGAGLFAASVRSVAPGATVDVVEASASAAGAVEAAFGAESGVTPVRLPVERFLAGRVSAPADGPVPDVVVLDPPRSGAGRPVMEAVATSGARRVVHVGCDVASFARDVGILVSHGWALTALEAVDAFPATHHVEAVAVLDAPGRVRPIGPAARRGTGSPS